MLAIVLTSVFLLDILLATLAARTEPGAPMRTVALVFFALQLLVGVGGGMLAMFRSF